MKNRKYVIIGISILLICLFVLILLTSINKNSVRNKTSNKPTVSSWIHEIMENKYVVTVLSQNDCDFCQDYKPVIEKYAEEKNIKLYYFQLDELSNEDVSILVNTYSIDFIGTPHTLITKDCILLNDFTGEKTSKELEELLPILNQQNSQ